MYSQTVDHKKLLFQSSKTTFFYSFFGCLRISIFYIIFIKKDCWAKYFLYFVNSLRHHINHVYVMSFLHFFYLSIYIIPTITSINIFSITLFIIVCMITNYRYFLRYCIYIFRLIFNH